MGGTTLKLGWTDPLTGLFGAHPQLGGPLDLNDGASYTLVSPEGLELPPPPRTLVPVGNIRTQGERATRAIYRHNREARCQLFLGPMSTGTELTSALRTLLAWVNAVPGAAPVTAQYQPPSATAPVSLDVVGMACDLPSDEDQWLSLQLEPITLLLWARPGLRGDRQTLANLVMNPGFEAPSGPGVTVFADSLTSAGAYTSVSGGAPTVSGGVLTVPSGATVTFGSPAWGDIQTWQVRWQQATNLTANFLLHSTDASNLLMVETFGNTLSLYQTVGGVSHLLASATPTLTPGTWYWLRVTQYPTVAGNPAMVEATLYADSGPGSVGAPLANGHVGPVGTFDAVTALSGPMGLQTGGAALLVGGAFAGVHTVALFRPGGWRFSGQAGTATGLASGAVDGATTLPSGPTTSPVTSAYAARTDCAPTGTTDARWNLYGGGLTNGLPSDLGAIPIATAGDTLGLAAWVKTTATLGAGATLSLLVTEYDASGAQLRQSTAASLTGPQTSWTQLTASYVTGANCAWVDLALRVLDATTGSAGASVWWENVQCWDVTSTGMATMPYCELRFAQSPAQLLLTGLEGDLPAPASVALGTQLASWPQGSSLALLLGRRGQVSAGARLVGAAVNFYGAGAVSTPTLDATAYHGYTLGATVTSAGWNPRGFSAPQSDLLGVYHLYNRFKSAQAVGNLGNVMQRVGTFLQNDAWIGKSDGTDLLGAAYGTWAAPLSQSGVWTLCDAGPVAVPPFPLGARQDPTANYVTPRPQVEDTTVSPPGGSACQINWELLLPVDGSLLAGVVNNPSNNPFAVSNRWLWVYVDGLLENRAGIGDGPAWGWSLEASPLANPAHAAGGYGTQTSGVVNVNLGAEPYLTLDPTLTVGGQHINQIAAVVADQAGAVLPLVVGEVTYTPLYLEPR